MEKKSLGQRALERALQKFGEVKLAQRLEVSKAVLRTYASGQKYIPEAVLLRVVDLIFEAGDDTTPPMTPHGGKPSGRRS